MVAWLILFASSFLQSALQANQDFVVNARNHPDNASANHLAGEYYLRHNQFADAIPYLEQARRLDPTNYINRYDLALAYLQTKALDKSRQLVSQLIKETGKAELHNLLGDVDEAGGRVDEAAREYELAARLDPSEKNLFDLGSDLLNHGSFQSALTVFQYADKNYPKSAKLHVGLGISYYSLGQYDDAVRTLCEAFDLNPEDTKALDFLGKMRDTSPHYAEEVKRRLAFFVHTYPSNAAAEYYYALSLMNRSAVPSGESNRATEVHLLRAIQLKPDFPDAHYELGVLYQGEGDYKKAAAQLEISAAQQPAHLQVHYHLAQVYQKLGRADLARREFATLKAEKTRQ
jgi:tetratricopeptide (TPR) repeat protein